MADGFHKAISTGDILSEATAMCARNAMLLIVAAVVLSAELNLFEFAVLKVLAINPQTRALWGLINTPMTMVIDYAIITWLLGAERLSSGTWSMTNLAAYFAMTVIGGIGTVGATLLLVVPGVIVLVRWSIAGNFLIARQLGPIAALKASWAATRDSAGAIFGVIVLLGLISIVGLFVISGHFGSTPTELSPVMTIIKNVFNGTIAVAGVCVHVSIFALLAGSRDADIGDVFA